MTPQALTELFETPNVDIPAGENEPYNLWGFGYPAATDNAIFNYDASNGATAWNHVDWQRGAAGARIAIFTTNAGSGLIQTPWVVNSMGNVYSFQFTSASSGHFVQMPGGSVLDITDHFAIAYPYVFEWSDNEVNWSNIGSMGTPAADSLVLHIAPAPAVTVQGQSFGPSRLWG